MKYPFLIPSPPRLSAFSSELQQIEESGWYTNFGPVNTGFEHNLLQHFFEGKGSVVTVNNATTGLLVAIKYLIARYFGQSKGSQWAPPAGRRFALMPSFTFAATAHAALWSGLTPLLGDVEPDTWFLSRNSVLELMDRYRDEIAIIIPYATFGNSLDIEFYAELSKATGIPVLIDAAASLGSLNVDGKQFGFGSKLPIIYSMHATKVFSTGEAGVIYCDDAEVISDLRMMTNFGFDQERRSVMPGINGKLSEVAALLCDCKLKEIDSVVKNREAAAHHYEILLRGCEYQVQRGRRQAHQFKSAIVRGLTPVKRASLVQALRTQGLEIRDYFNIHLARHPYIGAASQSGNLSNTNVIADAIVSLPIYDSILPAQIEEICELFNSELTKSIGD